METLQPYLNVPDISVLVLLILGILGGLRRGLSGELLRLITIVIAVIVGWKGADMGAEWLSKRIGWPVEELTAVSFFILIIASYLILSIIRHTFRLLLDFTFKGKLERIGGAFLGLVRASIFCAAALLGAALVPSEPVQAGLKESVTGTLVITNLVPLYQNWAEENPQFKLPEMEKIKEIEVESTPTPWDDYLGPLVDTVDEAVEDQTEVIEEEITVEQLPEP